MKYIITILALCLCSCTYNDMEKIFKDRPDAYTKFFGEFDYSKEVNETARNKFGMEFKRPIYETKNKKRLYYLGGNIYHNYDVFNRSFYVNGFGHLGMEF